MTTSSKKNSKKNSPLVSLRNFDPENEDFGTEVGNTLARNKKGASLTHGHLGDVKVMTSEKVGEGFEGKKYAGKSVSRQELYTDSDSAEDFDGYNVDDSEDFDGSNNDDSEDFYSENESSVDFDSEMTNSESENEYESENENKSDSDTEIKIDSNLSSRMRELEMDDEKAFDLISKSRPAEDDQKSQHVRNQLVKFDDYVDVRFKLQPLLNSFNRLPDQKSLLKAKRRSPEVGVALDEAVDELEALMRDLLDLSSSELAGDGIEVSKISNPKICDKTTKLQGFWDEMTRMDSALDPFARVSLQKWHNKMALSSDLKAKKTLKMLNQDPYQQVQIALQDEERLVARTRVYRDLSNKRFGSRLGAGMESPDGRGESVDIFDDNDFYQVLLKDWTASHGALSSTTATAMSALLLPSNNKKQHRDNVDPRASKGRKIRYDLHAKLVNYMVPQIEKGAWADSKIDEFYASLLGQSIQN